MNKTRPCGFQPPAHYVEFLTAVKNSTTVKGIDAAKMQPVASIPHSGVPDAISNTEPTAAIAEIEAPSKQTPVMGVYMGCYAPRLRRWTC